MSFFINVFVNKAISSTDFPNTPMWSNFSDCLKTPLREINPKDGLKPTTPQ